MNIDAKMTELIQAGILLHENGTNELYEKICAIFPSNKQDKRAFGGRIKRVVWTKEVDDALRNAVRMRLDIEKEFQPLYPYIPLEMTEKQARWHRGISTKKRHGSRNGKTLPGIGRIGLNLDPNILREFRMPRFTFDEPLQLEVKNRQNWQVMIINGANIGTRHGGDIMGNVSRRALSEANERGAAAVIATNIIALDLRKAAGPPKVARSLVFGDHVNPALIQDPEYQKIAEKIIEEHPMDEIIYRTIEELVDDILNGWMKISVKPNHWPEFQGPVYIVLGNNENKLIEAAAYWELRWWTLKKQMELRDKLRMAKSAKSAAEKRDDAAAARNLSQRIDSLLSQLHRTTVSSIATQELHRFYDYARAVVIQKIEKAIPNSKVIGQDTTFVKIGDKIMEIHIPSHLRVTDRLLSNYALQYGPKNLREKLADVILICHPSALQFRMTVREADYNGKRGSSMLLVPPIAIDDKYLRMVLRASSSQDHWLARAVFTEGFNPGVLMLQEIEGVVNTDVLSIDSLGAFQRYPKRKGSNYRRRPKYIWFMFCADPHWGGRAKEFVYSPELHKNLGMAEAVFHAMRRDGLCQGDRMPIHGWGSPDDQTQGQNFKARTQPHPNQMSYLLAEYFANQMQTQVEIAGSVQEAAQKSEQMKRYLLNQIELRGTDFLLEQVMQMMERGIEENIDVYSAILRRFKRSGLIIRGVGDFVNTQYAGFDTRNCGAINFGSGNHFDHTVEGEIVEGPFYAKHLRALLRQEPEWRDKKGELERLVVAPLYSGQSIGWATLQIPGGHEYGFEFRNKPTRMAGWGDTLLGTTKNFPMRGNYTRIFNGRLPILSVCGDKHFFGAVSSDYAFHHMCAAGTHTDRYGEMGFPSNNTGVSFIGLPAEGPESGPILVRLLPFNVIRDLVEDNPRSFDWESFLPNPA